MNNSRGRDAILLLLFSQAYSDFQQTTRLRQAIDFFLCEPRKQNSSYLPCLIEIYNFFLTSSQLMCDMWVSMKKEGFVKIMTVSLKAYFLLKFISSPRFQYLTAFFQYLVIKIMFWGHKSTFSRSRLNFQHFPRVTL